MLQEVPKQNKENCALSLDQEIKENLRYDTDTGELWWTKPKVGRFLDKPAGFLDGKKRYKRLTIKVGGTIHQLMQHRVAWFLYYGTWPTEDLDHKDRNGLNNRIENLRECTDNQNGYNVDMRVNNSSGFKGVHYHKKKRKWQARIRVEGRRIHLGYFNCPTAAGITYMKTSLNLHKEFSSIEV